eukprot:CAMPEP_0118967640 /NCGR_PEP_ID=MMETSP1173-20130426/5000_1 /TAXON_ID=1034831 /ORGANISM="Rhizochromulina marina cf, Strain CCMP1243" /LENGTH=119 /DNA_ID=CAMNT_0006916643 /DNA_START=57 /DNA_END=416 /DNA_ORIENTATION=-
MNTSWLLRAAVVLAGVVATAALGANDPIADNALGLAAKDCASQYCSSKDGLELWLALEQKCLRDPTPYLSASSSEEASSLWSPTLVGSASAIMGVAGLVAGLAVGGRFKNRQQFLFPVA